MTPLEVDVELAPGWLPLAPVPELLLAAALPDDTGRARAVLVVRMLHCPGLTDPDDADAMQQLGVEAWREAAGNAVCEVRWCAPEAVAVIAAHAAPGEAIDGEDLAVAVRQTAVYAVDSTGSAMRPSSAGEAKAGLLGSTRTV
jgi:hypothetical protein